MIQDIPKQRLYLKIRGAVQGVGFRPFIYRIATELGLVGWVNNSAQGVFIEVEGNKKQLKTFLGRIELEKPPLSLIESIEVSWLEPMGYKAFEIRASVTGEKSAVVLPEIATCPDCLGEIFDHTNRRYQYPFTNCTNCGPRYTIIEELPYDRKHTAMKGFQMCPQCQTEYENPLDRRFHAQPNACPQCGPHLELWDRTGKIRTQHFSALLETVAAIRQGKIVAVKGLGGFHLIVDARNEDAVQSLRQGKRRPDKPFALMYPSLELIEAHCEVSDLEERLLRSPQAPIVLLHRKDRSQIAPAVAPGNPYLGVMLPYTPLHHLLMAELGFPIVATSGNLSDEPICTDEREALQRLGSIGQLFLVHNRPIIRPVDDSVVRVVGDRPLIIRRARGYAPLPISLKKAVGSRQMAEGTINNPKSKIQNLKSKILSVGGHLKNTIAISVENQVFISQHIGDLGTIHAFQAFQQAITSLSSIYDFHPDLVACDAHPDYLSSQFAQQLGIRVIPVQHHYAHILSCMADNQLEAPVLGIAWDGTGYGLDGTIWGGEFLYITSDSFERVSCLRPFRLPGGEKAVKEPCRVALGLLYEIFGDQLFTMKHLASLQAFSADQLKIVKTMLCKNLNAPMTSSAGRLFDAVASVLGIRQKSSFEGQAAMELEFALDRIETDEQYKFEIRDLVRGESVLSSLETALIDAHSKLHSEMLSEKTDGETGRRGDGERETVARKNVKITSLNASQYQSSVPNLPLQIDFAPMVLEILEDMHRQLPVGLISAKFHNTLVEVIVAVAKKLNAWGLNPTKRVVFTGGCFQNKYLTERAVNRLNQENFRPYWHQNIPPNDGGIALGQVIAALRSKT